MRKAASENATAAAIHPAETSVEGGPITGPRDEAHLLEYLSDRVLLLDGAMGTSIHTRDLRLEEDFLDKENCMEVINKTRPDVIREIHMEFLQAGADAIKTNTFGGSPITLGEFDLADEAFDLNKRGCEVAREAIEEFVGDGRPRFVFGSLGPGTRLPTLGHIDYQTLEDALSIQCRGLIAGGADAILIETCQDPLQVKAAVNAAKGAREEAGKDIPIVVSVTVETTGTLLVGADIAAAATIVDALDVPVLGINCATGPQEMAEHVKWLGNSWRGKISVVPNAGLPELVDGQTHYPLGAAETAKWLERFVDEDGVNIIGGCCGTTPEHIAALDAMLQRQGQGRTAPAKRSCHWVPSIASLYHQVPLRQENALLAIGERCNANGSKKFREFQEKEDWDGAVAMGREQVNEGSHALDVCTAFVGRDEVSDMREVLSRMRGAVTAPLVIDSTELPVLEAALKLYGGKATINSINFEDGEGPPAARLELARKFGAAVIALTIDEEGMAKTVEDKVRIARRLYDFACNRHGLPPSDLLFDPLTFTICTGNEDDRKLGLWTLEAIERIYETLPECQIILGLSNISFGLKPAARHVLNSVFLDHAVKRGLTGGILHISKLVPLHKIPPNEVKIAEDLIFDRRSEGYDPLHSFLALFQDQTEVRGPAKKKPAKVEERLKHRIIDGDRQGLDADLEEALAKHPPLDIINNHLLGGMKVVGELFGAGKMQLPFVLQSAETMKAAVAYLEPYMERVEGQTKGTIIVATVKGDVHDIGKNLVDIILTNNGYKVVNLGIKQPLSAILQAAKEHKADAVGMSGLLVKSTVIMRENLEEMSREGIDLPVFLGGAALTRKYVEEDCVNAYDSGRVTYAPDAFGGLDLMGKVVTGKFNEHLKAIRKKRERRPISKKKELGEVPEKAAQRPVDLKEIKWKRAELAKDVDVPVPPFWGPRVIERIPVKAVLPYLNETMLFHFQWGFKKGRRSISNLAAWVDQEIRPILHRMVQTVTETDIFVAQAAYGYWKAASEGDDVVLFDEGGEKEAARFSLPRQQRKNGLCIADFFRDIDSGERDVIALQVVTIGQGASDTAREWFAQDRYQDYLYLHGLGVETAEALAEYVHKRIRAELGFGHLDDRDIHKMLKQGYRGSRYSFGYPACPNLADQRPLLRLLEAERIGIEMSEEDQLHPEQSTSAIVLHHPQAKYFSV